MACLRQVHSNRCLAVVEANCAGEADALITRSPGLAISVRTADCYPILLICAKTRAIAAVHAGWRGTAARIVTEALAKLHNLYGAELSEIYAAIGPGIGACCYQVGEDVARQFGVDGPTRLDLARINREQLIGSGVPAGQIETLACCTACEPRFYSYRREKEKAGRMISFIAIRDRTAP